MKHIAADIYSCFGFLIPKTALLHAGVPDSSSVTCFLRWSLTADVHYKLQPIQEIDEIKEWWHSCWAADRKLKVTVISSLKGTSYYVMCLKWEHTWWYGTHGVCCYPPWIYIPHSDTGIQRLTWSLREALCQSHSVCVASFPNNEDGLWVPTNSDIGFTSSPAGQLWCRRQLVFVLGGFPEVWATLGHPGSSWATLGTHMGFFLQCTTAG